MITTPRHSSESWNLPALAAAERRSEIPAFAEMTMMAGMTTLAGMTVVD
ncbi:MAG TPA: hypothetical protein VEX35_05845 [Allosphingosinicella sp.]|nr:hypothetical protein [Allosphingosinicella sp.]